MLVFHVHNKLGQPSGLLSKIGHGLLRLIHGVCCLVGNLGYVVDLGLYPVVDRRTQRSQTARREFPVGRIRDSPETARGKGCVFPICGPDPELKHEIRNSMYKQR